MLRDYRVYLEDILEAIGKITRYTAGLSLKTFSEDSKTLDAVVRNLEVVGEAIKNVPDGVRLRYPAVDWRENRWPPRYSGPRVFRNRCADHLGYRHEQAAGSGKANPADP